MFHILNNKPESEKFTHDQVGYENPSTHRDIGSSQIQDCDDCKHFIPATDKSPAGCEGVQRPISEEAWCHRFVRVRPEEPEETMKHHKFSHAHHTFHKDGSITSHLVHEDGPEHDVHSAHSNHDAMMDHMMDHTSAPNPGEAEANAGAMAPAAGGAPAGGAPPAGV